jgi:hypothetical protein
MQEYLDYLDKFGIWIKQKATKSNFSLLKLRHYKQPQKSLNRLK